MATTGVALSPSTATGQRYQFPQDLGTSTQGHWMLIDVMQRGLDKTLASVALHMPTGSGQGNIEFTSRHEYAESKLTKVAVDTVSSIPLVGTAIGGAINAAAGAAPMIGGAINPKIEVLYRDTGLRDFQYTFIMSPTSQTESQNLKDIVKTLRMYSAPTLIGGPSDPRASYIGLINQVQYLGTDGGGIFATPNEFIVRFFYFDEKSGAAVENTNIPKIGRCALTGIEIMYNPNAAWNTFHDYNPLSAQLTLAFKEMRVIDSNNIQDGY
jgi:hypothetical protein